MDPPGSHQYVRPPPPPQPFEIALIRKIESKTASVRDAFLLLDTDGDGRISPTDVRTVLHNEFGMDMTEEQEKSFFAHTSSPSSHTTNGHTTSKGMGYAEFAKYFGIVSSATLPASQSGMGAAVGFNATSNEDNENIDHELPIHFTPQTIRLQLRHKLRQLLTSHSSRTTGSGMKETSLFLAMDVHRSGRVTMQEFLHWLHSVGMTWTMDELKMVVLGVECEEGEKGWKDKKMQREQLERHWFGNGDVGGKEAGMTEHEFAEFVESLDMDCEGGGGTCNE